MSKYVLTNDSPDGYVKTNGGGTDCRKEIITGLIDGSLQGVRVPKEEPSEAKAQTIIRNMPNAPPIRFGRLRTYLGSYYVEADEVWILRSLETSQLRYPVIFHELAHATGHATRLNRQSCRTKSRRRQELCHEELLAEVSALYLCVEAELFYVHSKTAAEYVEDFLQRLGVRTPESRAAVLLPIHAEAVAVVDFILGMRAESKLAA